jgi:glycosyltransferase involved in cell wall biosynthesis
MEPKAKDRSGGNLSRGATRTVAWAVVAQAQTPHFQRLVERLTGSFGACLLLTGEGFPRSDGRLMIELGPRYRRSSVASRLRSWLAFTVFAFRRLWQLRRGTLCLVTTNPPLLEPLCWALSRFRGLRIVFLIWDLYPDHVVAAGFAGRLNPVVAAWRRLNRASLRAAVTVITIGERMAQRIAAQARPGSASVAEVVVIPNWADTQSIRPLAKRLNDFAVEHGQVGKVTVMYSGNLGRSHSLAGLLEAAERMRDLPEVSFLVVGGGEGLDEIEREVERRGVESLRVLPWQTWDRLPLSLATADIAVVSQAAVTGALSVPSRTYSFMAAGCALVALTDDGSDLAALVKGGGVGLVCLSDDAEALERCLRSLVRDADLLRACRTRARQLAEQRYSLDAAVARFEEALGSGQPARSGRG